MKTDNKQLLCTAAIVAGGIFLLRKNKAVNGVGYIDKYGIRNTKAKNADEVFKIIEKYYPNGTDYPTIIYPRIGSSMKHPVIIINDKMGLNSTHINVSKATADEVRGRLGVRYHVF